MLFATFLGCIHAIVELGRFATVGGIQKMNPHLSVGQVKRALKQLEREGYAIGETEPYGRTGRTVYRISNLCDTNLALINTCIDKHCAIAEGKAA